MLVAQRLCSAFIDRIDNKNVVVFFDDMIFGVDHKALFLRLHTYY